MKIRLKLNENLSNIEVLLNLNISDYMDGSADTISLSFITQEDISDVIYMGMKTELTIYNNDDEIIKVHYKLIQNIVMDKLSMYDVNGYQYTLTLKEHTVLLKNCIRTDLAITPALYSDKIYPTLKEATFKVVDCHNIPIFNEEITEIDDFLLSKLEKVACPVFNFSDLSTFDQLYDIFYRVGMIPYLENGKLSGILLQGNRDSTDILLNCSSYSTSKIEGTNYGSISTKVYNNVYDDEVVTVPSIFSSVLQQSPTYSKFTDESKLTIFRNTANQDDTEEVKQFVKERLKSWTGVDKNISDKTDSYKLLSVSGYNPSAQEVYDPNSYNINLPSDIEYIESIYKVVPNVNVINYTPQFTNEGDQIGWGKRDISLFFRIVKLDKSLIVEAAKWNQLSSLQKKRSAYYVKGSNKIHQPLSLIANEGDLQGDWVTSKGKLFDRLRETFYIVKYKPMRSHSYLAYDYNKSYSNNNQNLPIFNTSLNLPYKQVSDKQVSNILNYELNKKLDVLKNIKIVTSDTNVLKLEAGDLVKINDEVLIISTLSMTIDNEDIEIMLDLNKNIVSNSAISNYSDDVRVSTNLSSQSTVTRNVPIYLENIISLSDTVEYVDDTEIVNVPRALKINGLHNLGLTKNVENNVETIMSDTHKLKLKNLKTNSGLYAEDYIVKIEPTDHSSYNTEEPYYLDGIGISELEGDIKFTYESVSIDVIDSWLQSDLEEERGQSMAFSTNVTSTGIFKVFESPEEFGEYISTRGVYYSNLTLTSTPWGGESNYLRNTTYTVHTCKINGKLIFPSYIRARVSVIFLPLLGNPTTVRVYPLSDDSSNRSKLYVTLNEAMNNNNLFISTTGNILTICYDFENSYTNQQIILADEGNIGSMLPNFNKTPTKTEMFDVSFAPNITEVNPLIYNSSNLGCKLYSIGDQHSDKFKFEDFRILSDYEYGLIVDMGELINPTIQITTIPASNTNFKITEINKDLEWLSNSSNLKIEQDLKLFKAINGESITKINYNMEEPIAVVKTSLTPNSHQLALEFFDFLDELYVVETLENTEYVITNNNIPILKFKSNKDISEVYLSSIISDNY